jgi:hypothetical protein
MVVHHVEVHEVGPAGDHVLYLVTEAGEVGGQETGSDAEHGDISLASD